MFHVMKRMMKLAGAYRKNLIVAYLAGLLGAIAEKVPLFMILYALIGATAGTLNMMDFWIVLGAIVVSLVVAVALRFVREKNQSGSGYMIFARERLNLGDSIRKFPMSSFTEGNVGNLSAVISSDIKFIEEVGITQLTTITTSIITLVVTLLMLVFFSPTTALIMLATCLLVLLAFNVLQTIAIQHSNRVQEHQEKTTSAVIEYIKGMQVIKAFHLVGDQQQRINQRYERLSEAQFDYEKKFVAPSVVADTLVAIGTGAIVSFASLSLTYQTMSLAVMLLLTIFAFELFRPLSSLVSISAEIRMMESSLNRYEAVLKQEALPDTGRNLCLQSHDIEFKEVSFSYGEKPVLRQVSFVAKEKSITALVGKSGCGKTTICNLIARFWDSDDGQILLGGVDIRQMSFEQLLSAVSIVFQRVYLFNDTVYNNIAFGNPAATREQVVAAAKRARCLEFISDMPKGFDTVVGEGGATLSGGEKQRISIARALLKDAPIVLLDEATASVDPDNEHFIQQAISELVAEKTLIVIAHKLTTIRQADQILVMDEGRISERGTHDQLVKREGLYRKLWDKRNKATVGTWENR